MTTTTRTRICVVTGANKGIGFATTRAICNTFEGITYLTSRDATKGQDAVKELAKEGLLAHYHQLDISCQKSINTFVNYIRNTYGGLDILVNNAGIAFKAASTEGIAVQAEQTLAVNYFGTVNLFESLYPLFRHNARIVNVSSVCGCLSWMHGKEPGINAIKKRIMSPNNTVEDLNKLMQEFVDSAKAGTSIDDGWPTNCYVVSKVGISALTKIQQRLFDADSLGRHNMAVNSCHPGYVDTDMTSHKGPLSPEEGAKASVYLAMLPPGDKAPKGLFHWADCRIVDWETEQVSI